MHCHICDSVDDSITQDPRDGSWNPCKACQEVINDTVGNFGKDDDGEVEILDEPDLWVTE